MDTQPRGCIVFGPLRENFDVSVNFRDVSFAIIDLHVAHSADIVDRVQSCDFANVVGIRQRIDTWTVVWIDHKQKFEFRVRGDSKEEWLSVLNLSNIISNLSSSGLRFIQQVPCARMRVDVERE